MDIKKSWQNILINLGFTKKEARVYLASYCLGRATVAEIAKKAVFKRTTIYPIIDNLKRRGLLFYAQKGRKTYFSAQDPEILLTFLEGTKKHISHILPQIRRMRVFSSIKPKVTFYEGRIGFKRVWEEIFNSGEKEFLIITSAKEWQNFMSEKRIERSIIQKKIKLGIKSRQIITDSISARKILAKDTVENRLSKLAPPNFPFIATEIIFGHKIAIISTRFENLIMVIESRELSQTHKSYFELIWRTL